MVADFERGAAVFRNPRAVLHPGRAAGEHAGRKVLFEDRIVNRALQDVDLLPEVMRERPVR